MIEIKICLRRKRSFASLRIKRKPRRNEERSFTAFRINKNPP